MSSQRRGRSADYNDGGKEDDGTGAGGSHNPFNFDVDFSVVQKRRERALKAKKSAKDEAAASLLAGLDAALDLGPANNDGGNQGAGGNAGRGPGGKAQQRRHIIISENANAQEFNLHNRSKKGGGQGAGAGNFFANANSLVIGGVSLGNFVDGISRNQQTDQSEENPDDKWVPPMEPVWVGARCIPIWPYDDYHTIQKLYYEKLEEKQKSPNNHDDDALGRNESKQSSSSSSPREASQPAKQQQLSSIPIFSRPADPPDIPTAVQGLSLTAFEAKAEERAIAIVSTWLFDAGLIDELLVHGGMRGAGASSGDSTTGSVEDNRSVKSSEGVEIGSHGFPIEGSSKMDKEIAKLRNATKRQLALINARLNDGVAATGSEVQELVNAIIGTKDEISRLRELSTYVSNANDVETTSQFMLTKYPKLKKAINARRNLARCFRELDFFSQIPATCDRLRDELHAGEWTAHEWSTLRQVCREHVELEIFLVEAEAGMKKRAMEDENDHKHHHHHHHHLVGKNKSKLGRKAFEALGPNKNENNEQIDRFLHEHVSNVWELGDEIREKVMHGIASAFELAMNNPAGMVALVEAVEIYESANYEYRAVHGDAITESQNLRFTDVRAAALGELYLEFEKRGLNVFSELTSQAADVAQEEDEDAANRQFSAVLRAANELTSEIGIVKDRMEPCFPPNWSIATLWTTCVAHLCSNNILQQIGGPDGQKLPDLTVTQLLDLVAWVETFREIIEETFPDIGQVTSSRTYLDQPPQLLVENNKKVDIDLAQDSLAWVNNVLWTVHDLAKDEFLFRTKEQTEEWLQNVYQAEHTKTQTSEGRLVTSLCEDVWALAGVQLRTIRERLTRRSEALVQAVGVILKNLYEKQMGSRDFFCTDFETCCAAANDFVRMSEKCEEIVEEVKEECNLSREATETLEEQVAAILGLYSADGVYAAQKTHVYIFEPIDEAIGMQLFGSDWEDNYTHNDLALTLVRTLDDFMEDLESFLDEVMVIKAVEAQITSSVIFYLRCLMKKSEDVKTGQAFKNNERAISRMRGDIVVMREYFDGLAEGMPTLTRVIEKEFSILDATVEILSIAAEISEDDVREYIITLQKRIRSVPIVKYMVGDLYHLMKPTSEHSIYEQMDAMEQEMLAAGPPDDKAVRRWQDRGTVPGLNLDQMLAKHCETGTRKRPLKAGTLEQAQAAFFGWGSTKGDKDKNKDKARGEEI